MAYILVIEDASSRRDSLLAVLGDAGHQIEAVPGGEQVFSLLSGQSFDLVLLNIERAAGRGLEAGELIKAIKQESPETEVIVIAAETGSPPALAALEDGAYGVLTPAWQPEALRLLARRALERKELCEKLRALEEQVHGQQPLEALLGPSPTMTEVRKVVSQVARLDSNVLITGEPGSGKTLVARTLHALSDRRGNPLVVIPCAAIAEPLQESELFGRASRPSAGSRSDSRGQLERAEGGMALLDEVGKLAPAAQAKLMRFLQDGELKRVGASSTRSLNVRVLAASGQDLEKRVEQGAFREDLFYRLSVIRMHLAPLRERREDIAVLAQHFLARAAARSGTDPPGISPRALSLLMSQSWPGNVGELENVMERAIAQNTDGLIGLDDLPLGESWRSEDRVIDQARRSRLTLDELEREYILEVLAECGGSRKKTSERLGITTATLWRKLKQYEQTR